MEIIIKSGTGGFHPHYNRTMGKYYGTKTEYLSDLKSKGMEPYNPENAKKRSVQTYTPSKWSRDVVRAIDRAGGANGSIMKELKGTKMKAVPKELSNVPKHPKGGWF